MIFRKNVVFVSVFYVDNYTKMCIFAQICITFFNGKESI